jgi:intein/homing endonuclease
MNELTEEEKAYLAGFFDGEGCVFIGHHQVPGAVSPQYYLAVIFAQSNYEILKSWRDRIGIGRVYKAKKQLHHKIAWAWRVSDRQGATLLKWLLPYLRIKRQEAEIGIEFQETKYPQDSHRITPQPVIDLREYYRQLLLAMKHEQQIELPGMVESTRQAFASQLKLLLE